VRHSEGHSFWIQQVKLVQLKVRKAGLPPRFLFFTLIPITICQLRLNDIKAIGAQVRFLNGKFCEGLA